MKIAPSILRTNRTIYLQKLLSKLIFLFDGYYFESWINGLSKEEGIILFWMAYQGSESNLLFLKERSWKEIFDLLRKKDFEDYRKRKTVISIIRGRKFVVLLRLVSPITANSTEERKRRKEWVGREREREGRNSRPTFASRAKNRGAESRGSPRHPLLPSEFSIVPRVVPLAIFARLALSQIRFPLPVSLSLLVLIGPPPLPRRIFEPKRENARIPRETGVLIRIFPTARNHACGLHNLFLFFFSLSLCHLDEIIPGPND